MNDSAPARTLSAVHPRLLDNLNPEQLKAVTLGHESALVLAGAGSGKTGYCFRPSSMVRKMTPCFSRCSKIE